METRRKNLSLFSGEFTSILPSEACNITILIRNGPQAGGQDPQSLQNTPDSVNTKDQNKPLHLMRTAYRMLRLIPGFLFEYNEFWEDKGSQKM